MAGYSFNSRPNYCHAKEASRNLKIYINESEMGQIRKWTLTKDDIETGGDLFGLWIDKHTAVVQFVLGPGENCKRTPVSFFQDTKYLEKAGKYLTEHQGLCNIGQWHSHHRLSLNKPSAGNENIMWENMPNLRINRYIVFIANIARMNEVSVNCFLFEIQNGERLPVLKGKFEEVAGNNPFRQNKLLQNAVLPGQEGYAAKMRLAEISTKNTLNKTDDVENERKLRGTKLAKAQGKQTPSLKVLNNDQSEKSESRPKISPSSKQKCEDTNNKKREKDEGRLLMTTAGELPGKSTTSLLTCDEETPSRQQETPSRQQQTPSRQEQQQTPSRQQQQTPSRQQQQTPSRYQETPSRQEQQQPPLTGLNNDQSEKSESRPNTSPSSKQKCEDTNSTKREKDEGRLSMTTACELPGKLLTTSLLTCDEETPSRQQETPSRQEQQQTSSRQQQQTPSRQQQQTPSRYQETPSRQEQQQAPLTGLNNDHSENSESRPNISQSSKQKCEDTNNKKREKCEGRLLMTTACELPGKSTTSLTRVEETPSRHQETRSRHHETRSRQQQQTPSRQQQQQTPPRHQDANYTGKKYNRAAIKREVNNYKSPIPNNNKISADQKMHSKPTDLPPSVIATQRIDKSENGNQRRLSSSSFYDNVPSRATNDTPATGAVNTPPEKILIETQVQKPNVKKNLNKSENKRNPCCIL